MQLIKDFLKGMVIGVANIIPGVSGGTMMVVLGIYDRMIESVSMLRKQFKKSALFLLPLLLGAGAGIWLFSSGIAYMLQNHQVVTNFFFMGLIVGSIPMVFQKATESEFKQRNLIPFFVTLAIMIATLLINPSDSSEIIRTLNVTEFIRLTLFAAFAAAAMIIPGISGSFVMMMLGVYGSIVTAVSEFNIPLLIPIGLGVVIGIVGGAKIIHVMMNRFPQAMYFGILGFVVGSVPAIFPAGFRFDGTGVLAILAFVIGGALAYLSSAEWVKAYFTRKSDGAGEKE